MANIKISELSGALHISSTFVLPIVSGSVTAKATATQLSDFIISGSGFLASSSSFATGIGNLQTHSASMLAASASFATVSSSYSGLSGTYAAKQVLDRSTSTSISISNATDQIVRVSTAGGNVNLTLPDPAGKRSFLIKKTSTDANTITLVRFGSEQIEGVASNYLLVSSSAGNLPAWLCWADGVNFWVA
jgi:hypothetical protein